MCYVINLTATVQSRAALSTKNVLFVDIKVNKMYRMYSCDNED